MKKVIIIGGGFSGVSALKRLRSLDKRIDITLIDKKGYSNFLPMLPDILGKRIKPHSLECSLGDLCDKFRCKFIKEEVIDIDHDSKHISASRAQLVYDYLIVACGTETNFYGNSKIKKEGYKLDSVKDATDILAALKHKEFDQVVIAGGGYTGIEIASNLRRYFKKNNRKIPD